MADLSCFKAYDVRGAVPDTLSPQLVRAAGRAFVAETGARHVVIGRDARLSGPLLRDALCLGLRESALPLPHNHSPVRLWHRVS